MYIYKHTEHTTNTLASRMHSLYNKQTHNIHWIILIMETIRNFNYIESVFSQLLSLSLSILLSLSTPLSLSIPLSLSHYIPLSLSIHISLSIYISLSSYLPHISLFLSPSPHISLFLLPSRSTPPIPSHPLYPLSLSL